ncbi:LuxR C-terminal-related transcriptional regulator [Solirubrobacter ginsenosidimutans]|uniref:LuxR C-terminal-related transcriptional regulator n=1 Tax=Solirubrobacter ginsenosidimutans TaxID=490573 RepID=A0A9X3MX54_9ACTN|nr:LuxR C-terminal-related transcriptional regulator [Solirubrobacter ginsenosidimutans]MDA0164365.1 LuxR C-terminal-related transcriptional regulator [Solirubrobacter ginsenosidimutans]
MQLISTDASAARGLLDRDDLLQVLDRAVSRRVTIISAPPGSGKTSLLRAWAERATTVRHVTFVSVDRDQQDAQQFWCTVLDALAPETHHAPLDADQLVELIVSELAGHVDPVLLIDDLHELRSADALRQLEQVLAVLPSSARVVLSSRRDPAIRLHQLRLADEIAEIRAADLQFTERETRELLASAEVSLSDGGASALHQRTEGWAAGLRLAVISLNGHADPERFVAEFSGTDRAIGEYLMAEMLERQPSEVQRMLLRTSLVERLNGELADLLTGRAGSEQLLLELEDANAFVLSLDAERTWFRYHQLLADFLRLELRRTAADEVPALHRRAARWFADRGEVVEAVRQTLAAGDWPDAARLVADHSFRWVLDGQAGTIREVLQAFPEGASVDHPDLALAHAAAELNQGRLEEAAAQLALAESHVQSAPPARRRRLSVAIASLRLAIARRSGQFSEVVEQVNLLDASMADEPSESMAMGSELRGVALLNLGIVETWSGRLADAQRHLSEGAALAQTIGRPYLEVACRAHQGFPSKVVSVAAARERGRQAVALAERYGLDDRPILAPALGSVGGMAIWMGEFDEGERWLQRAWTVASTSIDPAAAVLLHVATGMLHAGRGHHRSALEAFTAAAQAQSLLTGVHALAPRITGWLASMHARLGSLDEARATLAGFSADAARMGVLPNARAVILLEEGDPAAAVEVLRDSRSSAIVSPFTHVEAHLLAGTGYLRLGERDAAVAAAEEALSVAESDRLIFPFALTDAAELLHALPGHRTAHGALLADVLDVLRGGPSPRPDQEPFDELSPSELRVLRYLPTNLTRPDIARELYVSINTVNTHIRNIYSKLGARDRSSAVVRARELRLLSAGRA